MGKSRFVEEKEPKFRPSKSHPSKFKSGWKFTSETPRKYIEPQSSTLIDDGSDGSSFIDEAELCQVCRQKGFNCGHYEYNARWRSHTLIKCCVCQKKGLHWSRDCPDFKNHKPAPFESRHPRAMQYLKNYPSWD
ncbi:hypothetical protein ACHQM5_012035 [Ranunculus cassubicifolius]